MAEDTHKDLARHLLLAREVALSACATEFEDLIGADLYPRWLGRSLSMLVEGHDSTGRTYEQFLTEIPTETSVGERKFLFNFFRHLWPGLYHVLEIGPFVGGSTRAMALGMLLNPNRLERCKLYTFDKFDDYYNPDRLLSFLAPLFESGVLDDKAKEHIKQTTDFQTIFRLIHEPHEYYPLVQPAAGSLPNTVQETETISNIFRAPPGLVLDAVFVDGCKSWFGTKYFMQEISTCAPPGSYFIFQDYGAFTCFWIPTLVAMLKDYFKLVAHVDNTYTFRLTKPLDAHEINARFPDSPLQMGKSNFGLIFRELLIDAATRNDTFTLVNYHLQHAAALAYIGLYDEAREKILSLLHRPEFTNFRNWILMSLNVPTYRPNEGNIHL
ncbi:MAG: hypothetical protein ACE5IY_22660 [bacterium]